MKLLILGGTHFVGRAVATEAVARGWEVTVCNRGNRPAPPGTRRLLADRTAPDGVAALGAPPGGGAWDAVVDTWSDAPRAVLAAARALRPHAGRYVYVSSRSVYAWPAPAGATEDAPVVTGAPDAGSGEYAANKRGGELAVREVFGRGDAVLLRAGLILGPHEDVGRLPWWLHRVARGGPVPAPGPRDLPLQYVDARDLAAFALHAVERGLAGTYDTVSAPGHTTTGALLDACVRATGAAAGLRWLDPATIADAGVEPWTELPVWTPPGPFHDALHGADTTRARTAGLRCRPVTDTVTDTWTWLRHTPDYTPRAPVGLPASKEPLLLPT
ncbi:NAD-dependent epimerase/dehydratase family protein [Streptomyces sp. TRM70308]|uniref:NAD-dependent epimerase/dehydratase family protein n=1 Tax=Streptomyces sp. TRM70308 TaxID=3131932 RepID=UPI003D06C289